MKKFRFIIPKVKISIILFLLFFSLKASAQTQYGCRFGLRIWSDLDASPHPQTPAYYNYSNSSDNGYSNFSGRCPDAGTSPCYIYHTDGTLRHTGTLGFIYDCPLDDYIPALIIFTIGIALVRLKKATPVNVNENIHHHGSL